MTIFFREWFWIRRFTNEVRRINPRISRRIANIWASDWLLTIDGATSLAPEKAAQEELSAWEFPS